MCHGTTNFALLGLNLHKTQDGSSLDFEYSSNLLKKGIEIIRGIFGGVEGDAAAIHLRNMYNISAPGFFKNLIFKGETQSKSKE